MDYRSMYKSNMGINSNQKQHRITISNINRANNRSNAFLSRRKISLSPFHEREQNNENIDNDGKTKAAESDHRNEFSVKRNVLTTINNNCNTNTTNDGNTTNKNAIKIKTPLNKKKEYLERYRKWKLEKENRLKDEKKMKKPKPFISVVRAGSIPDSGVSKLIGKKEFLFKLPLPEKPKQQQYNPLQPAQIFKCPQQIVKKIENNKNKNAEAVKPTMPVKNSRPRIVKPSNTNENFMNNGNKELNKKKVTAIVKPVQRNKQVPSSQAQISEPKILKLKVTSIQIMNESGNISNIPTSNNQSLITSTAKKTPTSSLNSSSDAATTNNVVFINTEVESISPIEKYSEETVIKQKDNNKRETINKRNKNNINKNENRHGNDDNENELMTQLHQQEHQKIFKNYQILLKTKKDNLNHLLSKWKKYKKFSNDLDIDMKVINEIEIFVNDKDENLKKFYELLNIFENTIQERKNIDSNVPLIKNQLKDIWMKLDEKINKINKDFESFEDALLSSNSREEKENTKKTDLNFDTDANTNAKADDKDHNDERNERKISKTLKRRKASKNKINNKKTLSNLIKKTHEDFIKKNFANISSKSAATKPKPISSSEQSDDIKTNLLLTPLRRSERLINKNCELNSKQKRNSFGLNERVSTPRQSRIRKIALQEQRENRRSLSKTPRRSRSKTPKRSIISNVSENCQKDPNIDNGTKTKTKSITSNSSSVTVSDIPKITTTIYGNHDWESNLKKENDNNDDRTQNEFVSLASAFSLSSTTNSKSVYRTPNKAVSDTSSTDDPSSNSNKNSNSKLCISPATSTSTTTTPNEKSNYVSPHVSFSRGKVSYKKEIEKRNSLYKLETSFTSSPSVILSTSLTKAGLSSPVIESKKIRHIREAIKYFRNLLNGENQRLTDLCNKWETYQNNENNKTNCSTSNDDVDDTNANDDCKSIKENCNDMINVTIGQTKLLLNKKLKQFSNLINECENVTIPHIKMQESKINENVGNNDDDKGNGGNLQLILPEDLEGFWSMVYLQIENIDKRFLNLDKWKENNWRDPDEKKDNQEQEKIKRKEQIRRKKLTKQQPGSKPNMKTTKEKSNVDDAAGGGSRKEIRSMLNAFKANYKKKFENNPVNTNTDIIFISSNKQQQQQKITLNVNDDDEDNKRKEDQNENENENNIGAIFLAPTPLRRSSRLVSSSTKNHKTNFVSIKSPSSTSTTKQHQMRLSPPHITTTCYNDDCNDDIEIVSSSLSSSSSSISKRKQNSIGKKSLQHNRLVPVPGSVSFIIKKIENNPENETPNTISRKSILKPPNSSCKKSTAKRVIFSDKLIKFDDNDFITENGHHISGIDILSDENNSDDNNENALFKY